MATLVFGPFELDTRSMELRKEGRKIGLRPQPCRVLAILASQPGRLVTRDELRLALWPEGVHVHFDLGLNSCLKQVRRALGETPGQWHYIETLTRRGYRFAGDVREVEGPSCLPVFRLAVMPFEPINAASAEERALALSLGDDVAVHLTQSRLRLAVVAYPGHGAAGRPAPGVLRDSGVDYVMEARIRIGDGRARVTAKLLALSDLRYLWAATLETSMADSGASQEDLSRAMADGAEAALRKRMDDRPLHADGGHGYPASNGMGHLVPTESVAL